MPNLGLSLRQITQRITFKRMSTSVPTAAQQTQKVTQPKWIAPTPSKLEGGKPTLKLYNSLTRSKDAFVPISGNNVVSWYSCGPTVYDAAHMGHARNYVSIDINRRIMSDYFGYNVKFVQNVTDIDDKIIVRARQNYLFQQFVKDVTQIDAKIISKVESALFEYIRENLATDAVADSLEAFEEWVKTIDIDAEKEKNPKFTMHLNAAQNAVRALRTVSVKSSSSSEGNVDEFMQLVKDVVVPKLDKELGSTVKHPEIFRELPAYWEHRFNKDMEALNVLPPTVTTRVSEYIPEIIEFVEGIIKNGYGYAAEDGSVYFDTVKFDSTEGHDYAKCQPWNKGKLDLISDAEGSLTNVNAGGKKSKNDFALWKASKPGEPEWDSPWGKGRPGWHIECSVMASDTLGPQIDIHSGGIDLAFPHHDNELAQSEARFDNQQWINYFLHTGHLHIEGQKMSKSLKNFITIEEALKKYSARQLRLTFASVQWNNQLDFKESLVNEVKSLELTFDNFFKNVRALRTDYLYQLETNPETKNISKKLFLLEKNLLDDLAKTQVRVHESFCDNLSTPVALKSLGDMVALTNTYISKVGAELRLEPVMAVCKYITKILNIIGFPARPDGLGWVSDGPSVTTGSTSSASTTGGSIEDIVMPYLKVLSNFRDEVRRMAIEKSNYTNFLKLTDSIRDHELLRLNVALDDRNGQAALIKFLTDDEKLKMIKLNEEKEAREEAKKQKKLEQQKLREAKEKERLEKAKVSPLEMFKQNDLYSAWDEQGIPTKDKDGNDITKSMTKKLKKQWEQQKKLHEEYFGKIEE